MDTYNSTPSDSILDTLSQPGQGIHKYRIGPFALFDTVLTILVCWLIWYYFAPKCWGTGRFVLFVCAVLLLSIPIHMYFGVETEGVKWWRKLSGSPSSDDVYGMGNDSSSISSHLNTVKALFTGAKSSTPNGGQEVQIAGAGRDTDYYPLDEEDWRAAPVDTQYQTFSQI